MTQDKFILSVGAQVGGCLVDGLGDGVMVQAPGLEKDMLRSVCFGLLQVNALLTYSVVAGRTLVCCVISLAGLKLTVNQQVLAQHVVFYTCKKTQRIPTIIRVAHIVHQR